MISIRVQYDAYERRFKLVDKEMACLLSDGETYVVTADSLSPAEEEARGAALETESIRMCG